MDPKQFLSRRNTMLAGLGAAHFLQGPAAAQSPAPPRAFYYDVRQFGAPGERVTMPPGRSRPPLMPRSPLAV